MTAPTDLAPFAELAAITTQLLEAYGHRPLRVDLIRNRGDWWGQTDARSWIRYKDPCPLWVVAHEGAHVLTGCDHDHPQWIAAYRQLLGVTVAIADQRHEARLASAGDGRSTDPHADDNGGR